MASICSYSPNGLHKVVEGVALRQSETFHPILTTKSLAHHTRVILITTLSYVITELCFPCRKTFSTVYSALYQCEQRRLLSKQDASNISKLIHNKNRKSKCKNLTISKKTTLWTRVHDNLNSTTSSSYK